MGLKGIWYVLLLVCALLVVGSYAGGSCDDGLPCGPCVTGNCFFCANGSTEACVLSILECPNRSVIIITPGVTHSFCPPDPTSSTTTYTTTTTSLPITITKESPLYFYFCLVVVVVALSLLVVAARNLYYNAAALYSITRASQVTLEDSTVVLVM